MPLNFLTVVSAVLGIPIVFLMYEYVSRPNETLHGAFQKAGPDFCLIGLGSSGSIFIDPQVTSSFQLAPQLCLIFAIAVILNTEEFLLQSASHTSEMAVSFSKLRSRSWLNRTRVRNTCVRISLYALIRDLKNGLTLP